MTENASPMGTHLAAMNTVRRVLRDAQGDARERLVTTPATPLSNKPDELVAEAPAPKRERLWEWARVRSDPAVLGGMLLEARSRYQLPKDKPVSRTLFERFVKAEAELRKEMTNAPKA